MTLQELRHCIAQWIGIPVSIGMAKTKVLAKAANHIAKKHAQQGVFALLDAQRIDAELAKLPIAEIWGIGRAWCQKLNRHRIYTAYDLKHVQPEPLQRNFNVQLSKIIYELRGQPCADLEPAELGKPSFARAPSANAFLNCPIYKTRWLAIRHAPAKNCDSNKV